MDSSILARLSPEIRNAIYEQLFTRDYDCAVTLKHNAILHAFTAACRQIRNETLGMYLAMTRFNAHLDDGPAIPLARWLRAMGAERCLLLREVNIWDLHMLNGTLHGRETTQRLLRAGTEDGESYVLRPVGREVFHKGWYLKDVVIALQAVGLGLARFCVVQGGDHNLKQTSQFAILQMSDLDGVQRNVAGAEQLAEQFGLSDVQRSCLVSQLEKGYEEVRLLDGRRNIIMNFDSMQRLLSIRQEFIPRDEEFYL